MKRYFKYIVMLVISLATAVSCTKDADVDLSDYNIALSQYSIKEECGASIVKIDVTTTDVTSWVLSCPNATSWCKYSSDATGEDASSSVPLYSTGTGSFYVTISENTTVSDRSSYFMISARINGVAYNVTYITIDQEANSPYLEMDESSLKVELMAMSSAGSEELISIPIKSNVEWVATLSAATPSDWITLESYTATNSGEITFTMSENSSYEDDVVGQIIVSPVDLESYPDLPITIDILQESRTTNVVFTIEKMTSYLSDGSGIIKISDSQGGDLTPVEATVETSNLATTLTLMFDSISDVEFEDGVTYTIVSYTPEEGAEIALGSDFVYSSESSNFTPENWDPVTNTFSGSSEAKPIIIDSYEDFIAFSERVNAGDSYAGLYLRQDINLILPNTVWTPIGNSIDTPFSGSYNGNDKQISGLTLYSAAAVSYQGLFGYVTGSEDTYAEIKNLTLSDDDNSSVLFAAESLYCGALVANATEYVNITNCTNEIDNMELGCCSGGLIGMTGINKGNDAWPAPNNDGTYRIECEVTVSYCHNKGNITLLGGTNAYNYNSGGLIGLSMGSVYRCSNQGKIATNAVSADNPYLRIGGVVGALSNTIKESYNIGVMELGYSNNCGGVVGYLFGNCYTDAYIINCYNAAQITATHATGNTGGILGNSASVTTSTYSVQGCYNAGAINAAKAAYVIGAASDRIFGGDEYTHSNLYLASTSLGGNASSAIANSSASFVKEEGYAIADYFFSTTADNMLLKSTFTNSTTTNGKSISWDFTDVWAIEDGVSFPYLINNAPDDKIGVAYTIE